MVQVVQGSDQYGALATIIPKRAGRELSFLDIQNTNNVCILGGKLKESLFNFVDPVGQYISINGQLFQVVGWYEKGSGWLA